MKKDNNAITNDASNRDEFGAIDSRNGNEDKHGSHGGRTFSRRGFLGQITTVVGTFAAAWPWVSSRPASALTSSDKAQSKFVCEYPCSPPPPPPPPVNYSTQSEALVNNLVATFNDHNVSGTAAYFDNANVDTSLMETHLTNAFTSMPTLTCTVTSMTVGPYGEYVTLDYDLAGEYKVRVEDEAVDADDVAIGASDTVTGTTTLYIEEGSYIYDVLGSSNIVTVFEAHDAEFELAS